MAISIGISQERFWTLSPHKIYLEQEGYNLRKQREAKDNNWQAYLQGQYFLEALAVIATSIGKGKRHEYPSKPYELNFNGDSTELTEEEKITKTKMLFASLETMQANFNNNHREKNKDMDNEP